MSLLGHEVVHDGEDSLLHLTCVLRSQDDHLALLEVQRHCSIVDHVGDVPVSAELSSIEDVVVCSILEVSVQLLLGGLDEHVRHEEGVVGAGADDSDADPVLRVPSGIAINNIQFAAGVEV